MRNLLALFFLFASTATAIGGQSAQSITNAGMPANCSTFASKVSQSEGNFTSTGVTHTKRGAVSCYGAFQFCSAPGQSGGGTFGQYSNGLTPVKFEASPSAQISAWTTYEQKSWSQAQTNNLTSAVGKQVCYQGKCATLTQSSILMACQFGCGTGGKLAHLVNAGMNCNAPGITDGKGTNVCSYLIKGTGYDVSCFTGGTTCKAPGNTPQAPVTTPAPTTNFGVSTTPIIS